MAKHTLAGRFTVQHQATAGFNYMIHSWAFEANSIQAYILETGRLADAVGASLLVDRLTGDLGDSANPADLLSMVLRAAGVEGDQISFSRRGGGAFLAFFKDDALLVKARALWHAALHTQAPGLRWSDGKAQGETHKGSAQAALRQAQHASKTELARLPEAGPLVLRVPRTGQPAMERRKLGAKGVELVDAATLARRLHGAADGGLRVLTDRFLADKKIPPDEVRNTYVWPRNMEEADDFEQETESDKRAALRFPFVNGDHEVAFVHADGNGLGVMLRELEKADDDKYLEVSAQFSMAVATATRNAVEQATAAVLLKHCRTNADGSSTVPARPLVLGGDDVTLIIRADLALPFVEVFLAEFAKQTRKQLKHVKVRKGSNLGGLTAACGVAFVKSSFPFMPAQELAEQLCKRAKTVIKREAKASKRVMPLSAVAIQRVTTSMPDQELPVLSVEGKWWPLGHSAYVLPTENDKSESQLPRLADLNLLASHLSGDLSPRGPARKLLIDLQHDIGMARERYRRWRSLRETSSLQTIDPLLKELGVGGIEGLPLGVAGTPWPDALLLAEMVKARVADTTAPADQAAA